MNQQIRAAELTSTVFAGRFGSTRRLRLRHRSRSPYPAQAGREAETKSRLELEVVGNQRFTVSFNAIGVIEPRWRGLDSGAAGLDLDGRECRWRLRGSATIGSPPMVEHVSPQGFLGGVLLAGIVVGFIAWPIAYRRGGRERTAIEVQLLAAQANLESAAQDREQDRAEYERNLAAAAQERERDRAEHENELAAAAQEREQARAQYERNLAAAAQEREQDRAEHENELSTVRECHQRARAEAMWRSLSVSRTDWHDSLDCRTDGRLARNMD